MHLPLLPFATSNIVCQLVPNTTLPIPYKNIIKLLHAKKKSIKAAIFNILNALYSYDLYRIHIMTLC